MNLGTDNYYHNRNGTENNSLVPSKLSNNGGRRIKLVVVGNSFIGKTSLLFAYTKNQFFNNYQTTIFDNYAITLNMDHKKYTVNLFDTAGQEDYAHLRILSYPQTDIFLLCFSLINPESLEACRNVWMPEIRKHAGGTTPVLLIGTKEDLTDSPEHKSQHVSIKGAQRAAAEMGCVKFLACSSLTHRGLKQVFDEAIITAIYASATTMTSNRSHGKTHDKGLFSCCYPI